VSGVRVPAPPPLPLRPGTRLPRLEPVLRRALSGPCAIAPGERLLVAVSGGADSTAMLLGLTRIAREFRVSIHAAHLHHGLRGKDADGDLAFVRALSRRLAVPLIAARWDCRARMARRGLSGQAGLRTLRREFLAAAARRAKASAIATAHTADDQLETLLLRLGRGTGLLGLAGMRPRSGAWIKPLLAATRLDIEADLGAQGETWREDRSNRDPHYARSRVRHEVIPALARAVAPREKSPARARAALALRATAAAGELAAAERLITRVSARILARLARLRSGEIALDSRALASYPSAIQRSVLRLVFKRPGYAGPHLTLRHLNALQSLLATTRGGSRVDLPNGWRAVRDRGQIIFARAVEVPRPGGVTHQVPARGRFSRGTVRGGWLTGATARGRLGTRAAGDEYFAVEALSGGLELRPAKPDEWFMPFGGRGPRRLGEFLSKQPVPRALKARPIVLADARGILWVVGVRRAARAPVTETTQRALWVHAETP
jgi:tRNA(Ile)-lysidine synthase